MDLEQQFVDVQHEIDRIEAITAPYERQLASLRGRRHELQVSIALAKYGFQMGDKLVVTNAIRKQQAAYGWLEGEWWPLGAVITVDGIAFADSHMGEGLHKIAIRYEANKRTITTVKIVKEMRAAYIAKFGEG